MFTLRKFVLSFIIFFVPLLIMGQAKKVIGRVFNAETAESLAGVNVSVKNFSNGTTTDEDGYFEISLENLSQKVLLFEYVGFSTREYKINKNKAVVEITLIPEALRMEPIIVTGVRAEKRKSPVPFTSLNKKYIKENYGAKDVPMLLKEIPGLYSYSDNGTGIGYSYLKIRGFDAKRVSVMVNGVPHNDPEEHSVYWVDMPDLAESATNLQVQRGVGISPYAVSSFGGSINLITTGIPSKLGPELTFGIGSYNTQKYSAQINNKLNDNYYTTFRLSKINTDGYRDRSGVDLWSYYFKLIRSGKKSFTQLNMYGGNEKTHAAWDASSESELKKNHKHNPYTYHNEIDYFNQPHFELINNYQWKENVSFNNTLFYIHGNGYYEQKKNGKDLWQYGLISVPDSIKADLIREKQVKKNQLGWVSQVIWKHNKNLTSTLGLYFSDYQSNHHGEVKEVLNAYNLITNEPISADFNNSRDYYKYAYDKKYYNFYLMESGNLWKDKLTWQANLYFQNIDFSFKHKLAGNFREENLHAYKVNYTHISPRIGINYNVNKNWNAYLSFSTAEKEPNADDVFDNWSGPYDLGVSPKFTSSDTIYKNGIIDHIRWRNPQVKEETLVDWELGIAYKNSFLFTELNLYRMYFDDEIVPFGAVDDEGDDVKGNADESIHEGFEFSLNYKPKSFFEIASNISYSNNYFKKFVQKSFSGEGIINHKNKKIAGFPDWLSNLAVMFGPNDYRLKLIYRYVGRIYLDNTQNKDRSIKPTNKLVDLQVLYKVPHKYFQANVVFVFQTNNIFNQKYYTSGYYYYGNYFVPSATRNYMLTLRMDF